jgi:hypothetical protein
MFALQRYLTSKNLLDVEYSGDNVYIDDLNLHFKYKNYYILAVKGDEYYESIDTDSTLSSDDESKYSKFCSKSS